MSPFEMACQAMLKPVHEARAEWRESGMNETEIADATARLLRDRLRPFAPDVRDWPAHLTLPRCAYCHGSGLVIRQNVTTKLNTIADVGEPCRCPRGARFLPPVPTSDFTEAGKVPPPKKGFTRFGQ